MIIQAEHGWGKKKSVEASNNGLAPFQPYHKRHSHESGNPVVGKEGLDSRVKPENDDIKQSQSLEISC